MGHANSHPVPGADRGCVDAAAAVSKSRYRARSSDALGAVGAVLGAHSRPWVAGCASGSACRSGIVGTCSLVLGAT